MSNDRRLLDISTHLVSTALFHCYAHETLLVVWSFGLLGHIIRPARYGRMPTPYVIPWRGDAWGGKTRILVE